MPVDTGTVDCLWVNILIDGIPQQMMPVNLVLSHLSHAHGPELFIQWQNSNGQMFEKRNGQLARLEIHFFGSKLCYQVQDQVAKLILW